MKKYILAILLLTTVMYMPANAYDPMSAEAVAAVLDIEAEGISIFVNGRQVRVVNAEGEDLEVYNLTGQRVATIHIDSNDQTMSVNLPKGCYILKVGKIARKVSIR